MRDDTEPPSRPRRSALVPVLAFLAVCFVALYLMDRPRVDAATGEPGEVRPKPVKALAPVEPAPLPVVVEGPGVASSPAQAPPAAMPVLLPASAAAVGEVQPIPLKFTGVPVRAGSAAVAADPAATAGTPPAPPRPSMMVPDAAEKAQE